MASGQRVNRELARLDTVDDFLDALKEHYRLTTDYQLFPLMGVTRQAVYRYRAGGTFDDEVSGRVAALLVAKGVPVTPHYVLACMASQRARTESGRVWWNEIKRKLQAAAAVVALSAAATVGGLVLPPSPAAAAPAAQGQPLCIMLTRARRRLAMWAAVTFGTPRLAPA